MRIMVNENLFFIFKKKSTKENGNGAALPRAHAAGGGGGSSAAARRAPSRMLFIILRGKTETPPPALNVISLCNMIINRSSCGAARAPRARASRIFTCGRRKDGGKEEKKRARAPSARRGVSGVAVSLLTGTGRSLTAAARSVRAASMAAMA